jgi:hypothetical protein
MRAQKTETEWDRLQKEAIDTIGEGENFALIGATPPQTARRSAQAIFIR